MLPKAPHRIGASTDVQTPRPLKAAAKVTQPTAKAQLSPGEAEAGVEGSEGTLKDSELCFLLDSVKWILPPPSLCCPSCFLTTRTEIVHGYENKLAQ